MMDVIEIGSKIPDVDVELCSDSEVASRSSILEVVGRGSCILVGMPGAFTPTCNDRHMPGYYNNANKFKELGVSSIAVITTNDRFVNYRWQQDLEQCTGVTDSGIQLVSDPRGDLSEAMGLIAYLGRALGVRAKRFALVLENGVVQHLVVDEGSVELEKTSAEQVMEFMQERKPVSAASGVSPGVFISLGAVLSIVALVVASTN